MDGRRRRHDGAPGAGTASPSAPSGPEPGVWLSKTQPPSRVVIEDVEPEVDGGRFPIKRIVGESVRVSASIYADGHDRVAAALCFRAGGDRDWIETPMRPRRDGRFEGEFRPSGLGRFEYTIRAWIDRFATWRSGLERKVEAGQEVNSELLEGAGLLREAIGRAGGADAAWLRTQAAVIEGSGAKRIDAALAPELAACMARNPDRSRGTDAGCALQGIVERARAASGAWYELFPRSCADEPGRHGTLADTMRRLPYVASMGFDVLYLPPIHPIGVAHRKGRDNGPAAAPGDPGSPWAIGSSEGGHTAVHPALGTLADFDDLVKRARDLGLEIALDLAFQCSPDHPWVTKHPGWFHHRPDGSIQYAENPPKRYQDIYPLDFECAQWKELWQELRGVVLFWIEHGVSIFRVDNPHTKPFAFWEWLIDQVREAHPETVFLAEAFTRPSVMRQLAKRGFSQSYTYFTWRNTRAEIVEYATELSHTAVREYMRPNFFANTPDILHEYLQAGGRAAFQIRLVLAATLAASYGIYGPLFELCVDEAVPGTEEYLGSEKYQVRHWDLDQPGSLRAYVTRVNAIRRENPALLQDARLRFCEVDNERLVAYVKSSVDFSSVMLVVVNLDPHRTQSGWLELPLDELGIDPHQPYQVHDLLGGARYLWDGPRNFVALDPAAVPAHVFRLRRRIRTERDFDYFL